MVSKLTTHGVVAGAAALILVLHTTAQAAGTRKLVMQVHEVKAVKECRVKVGPFSTTRGADEIDLGAVVIDPVDGVRVRTLNLGKFGHDGSKRPFGTPHELLGFKVSGGQYPKARQVLLALAERDSDGGFGKYLNTLAEEAKKKMSAAKSAHSGPTGPAFVRASYPQAEAAAAEVAKEALERIGRALLAFAADAMKDDIFPPSLESVTIPNENFRFGGTSLTSPRKVARFKSDRCDYSLTYSWKFDK